MLLQSFIIVIIISC